jgi:hypothetical protein
MSLVLFIAIASRIGLVSMEPKLKLINLKYLIVGLSMLRATITFPLRLSLPQKQPSLWHWQTFLT